MNVRVNTTIGLPCVVVKGRSEEEGVDAMRALAEKILSCKGREDMFSKLQEWEVALTPVRDPAADAVVEPEEVWVCTFTFRDDDS